MTENNDTRGESRIQVELVPFHGDQVQAIRNTETGEVDVVINLICQNLGVTFHGQIEKLKKSPWAGVRLSVVLDARGVQQPTWVIPVKNLSMWLAGIQAGRVREEIRPKLIAYQVECAKVLDEHFRPAPKPEPEQASFDPTIFYKILEAQTASYSMTVERLISTDNKILELHEIHAAKVEKFVTSIRADEASQNIRICDLEVKVLKHEDDLVRVKAGHPTENRDKDIPVSPHGPQPTVEPRRRDESFDTWLTVWEYCRPRGIPFNGDTLRVQSAKIGALSKRMGFPPMCRYIPELRQRRKVYPTTVLNQFYGDVWERSYRVEPGFKFNRRDSYARGAAEVDNGNAEM